MTNSKGFLRAAITLVAIIQAAMLILFVTPPYTVFAQSNAGQGEQGSSGNIDITDHHHDGDTDQSQSDDSDSHHDSAHELDRLDGNHDGGDGHDGHGSHGGFGGGENPTPVLGSITICKILLNSDGTIATSSAPAGVTFTIPGLTPDPETSLGPTSDELSPTVFTTPLALSSKILDASAGNDAQCVTHSNLVVDDGGYYYGQEMVSTTTGFAAPKYDDQASGVAHTVADFSVYSGELFDVDASNDASRNLSADGYIQLTVSNPNQTLVVLNQLLPLAPAATSTPTDTNTSVGTTNSNSESSSGNPPPPAVIHNGAISIPYLGGQFKGPNAAVGQVLGTSTEATSCVPLLKTYLRANGKNDASEVMKLQTFLNGNLGDNLPINGTFGPQTQKAVGDFQLKYRDDVLKPWLQYGLATDHTPTKFVYKTTQRKINNLYCASLNLPQPQLP